MSDATQTLKYLVVTKGRKIVYPTCSMDVVGAFTVGNLKKAMWEKYSHRDVEARRLNVYCPSIPLGDEEDDEDEDSDDQERIQSQVAEAFGNNQIVKLKSQQLVQGITQTLIIEIPRFLPLPVWYTLVDHENNALGSPEQVSAESIADLRLRVKDQNELQHVDASNLVVWRCEPKLFTQATTDEIKALNFKTAAVKLRAEKIWDLGLDEEEMLIVQMPGTVPLPVWYTLVDHENNALGSPAQVSTESIADLRHRVKDRNELQHVDASDLVVWRCEPKLFTQATTDEIKALNFKTAAVKLKVQNIRSLSLDYTEMLIVQMPGTVPLPVWYTLVDHENNALGSREQVSTESIADLRHRVKDQNELQHVDARNLVVWRCEPKLFTQATTDEIKALNFKTAAVKLKVQNIRSLSLDYTEMLIVQMPGTVPLPVWYTLVDHENNALGSREQVSTESIADLRHRVKDQNELQHVDASDLVVWRCEPKLFTQATTDEIKALNFKTAAVKLIAENIRSLGLEDGEMLIIQMPAPIQPINIPLCYKSVAALRKENLRPILAPSEFQPDPIFFLAYCDFKTLQGRDAKVSYSLQPFEEKLLFYGTCSFEDGEEVEVCIKFVKRYSLEAHKWCTSEEKIFAPRVIGFADLGGGWKMVVMERIDESFKMVIKMARTKELYELIKEKLTGLHQKGYVHGDVRDVNIMVKEEDGGYSVRLLDFDWAGEIGETRYPRNVGNRKGMRRPREVYDGELIKAEHDIKMLDYMFRDIVGSTGSWWILEPVE